MTGTALDQETLHNRTLNRRYLLNLAFVTVLVAIALLAVIGGPRGLLINRGDKGADWYQNLAGRSIPEIQDQDFFRHDIAGVIKHVKSADIVILGSSLATFAFDDQTLHARLEERYGLRVYNMAFVGVASGEFSRIIIGKYHIRPKLWIINADDGGGGGSFFSRSLVRAFGADAQTIQATTHGRSRALYDVVRKNMKWRLEALEDRFRFWFGHALVRANPIPDFYRNVATGAADMSDFPRYLLQTNPAVVSRRSPDCHSSAAAIDIARSFRDEIGGVSILTFVPNMHGCEHQAAEIARAIAVDFIPPGPRAYSSWDGGGHLDKRGARDFTEDFVAKLEQLDVFKATLARRVTARAVK